MNLKEHIKIKQYDSYQKRLARIKSGEFQIPISSEVEEKISNVLTNPESKENLQENFHEQEILNQWKEKFPEWYREYADKIISHPDGIEFKIEGLEGKKTQRENLKPEPNGTTITKIPEEELKVLSPELQEKLKDEVLIDFNSAQKESAKIGMRPIDSEWKILIDSMPGENKDEKSVNLREFLDLPFAGYRTRNNGSFINQGSNGNYWSSTARLNTSARYRNFNSSGGDRDYYNKSHGFSVRCIKD